MTALSYALNWQVCDCSMQSAQKKMYILNSPIAVGSEGCTAKNPLATGNFDLFSFTVRERTDRILNVKVVNSGNER